MTCTCHVGPGKFEGESALTFMAYQQAMLGNSDMSVGRYDFFKAPFMFDADQSVIREAKDYGYCDECIEKHDDHSHYGMVISQDDRGFVWRTVYDTQAEYDAAVTEAEAEDSESQD